MNDGNRASRELVAAALRRDAAAQEAAGPPTDPVLVRHFELGARPGLLTRFARCLGWAREGAHR